MDSEIKVCHLTSVHKSSDVRIFSKECVTLANNGYDVSVVGIGPTIKNMGIQLISFPQMTRVKRIVLSAKIMKDIALRVDAEIYHLHDPELLPLISILKRKGKRVIFDSHENVPEQILHKEYLPKFSRRILSFLYRKFERRMVLKADGIVIVTPAQRRNFENVTDKVHLVTNFPTSVFLKGKSRESDEVEKKPQICFAGGVTSQWSHQIVIESLTHIPDLKYVFAGPKNEKYLEEILQNPLYIEKVKYLGVISREQVERLYEESICGIALLSYNTQVGREGTLGNTKLFEYMKHGLPVICSDLSIWKDIVTKYECGIVVNPEDEEEVVKAFEFIAKNREKAKQMGNNGREAFLKEYNWESQIPQLLHLYERIAQT
jgi:glycosyltransferase involved in cell wall biosynthesis